MTITTARSTRSRFSKSGFTMIELMVAVAVSGLFLAGAMAAINQLARASVGVANYADMNGASRRALDVFSSDVRMAHAVNVCTSTQLNFDIYDSSGTTITLDYSFDSSTDTFTRRENGVVTKVLEDVETFSFSYFDLTRTPTTQAISVKEVQIEAVMLRSAISLDNTNEIISARFMMRNKSVGT